MKGKTRPSWQAERAGEEVNMNNRTRSTGQVKSIGALVTNIVLRCTMAEQRLICAAWWNETAFHDAMVRHGLTPSMFADRRCGYLAWYLCACAECGVNPSEPAALRLAETTHAVDLDPLDAQWLTATVGEIHEDADDVDKLAEMVATLAGHREGAAKAHLRGLAETCVDLGRYTVRIEERQQSFVPGRLKGRAHDSRIAV